MNFDSFKKEIRNRLPSYLPIEWNDWKVEMYYHYKVNQKLDAVTVKPPESLRMGKRVYPVFYIQDLYDLYKAGNDLGKILRYVSGVIKQTPDQGEIEKAGFDINEFQDSVVFQVINAEKNRELLKTLPHRLIADLAVIYRILRFDEDGKWAGMLVTHEIRNMWNVSEKQLYEKALAHTPEALPFVVNDIGLMVVDGEEYVDRKTGMIMISNDSFQFGASALLYPDILEMAAEELGGNAVILPGSIHELYLVADDPGQYQYWKETVERASKEVVREEEWLSDHIYRYSHSNKTVTKLL